MSWKRKVQHLTWGIHFRFCIKMRVTVPSDKGAISPDDTQCFPALIPQMQLPAIQINQRVSGKKVAGMGSRMN